MNHICMTCGSTESQALIDARALGFEEELQNGVYTCCQIVTWADEQWLVWLEAARQDLKSANKVTRPPEPQERVRSRRSPNSARRSRRAFEPPV
jgi:hypothetical protein